MIQISHILTSESGDRYLVTGIQDGTASHPVPHFELTLMPEGATALDFGRTFDRRGKIHISQLVELPLLS